MSKVGQAGTPNFHSSDTLTIENRVPILIADCDRMLLEDDTPIMPEQAIKRELSLGEIISKTFEVYRRDFTKYFILFAGVEVIIAVVTALAQQAFVLPIRPPNSTPQQFLNWLPGFLGALFALVFSIFVVTVLFFPIAQGSATKLASEQIEKGQADLGASARFATSRFLRIWAVSFLVGIILVLGFIALIVPGIIPAIIYSLAFPVLIIENKGVLDSMGRSRQLVGHRWLKTFGAYLVLGAIFVIAWAIVGAIAVPFGAASPVVSGLLSALYQPLLPILLTVYYYSNLARTAPSPGDSSSSSTSSRSLLRLPNVPGGVPRPSSLGETRNWGIAAR